jgi:DNA-binding NtrC family response regulator
VEPRVNDRPEREQILLVDDEADLVYLAAKRLDRAGYDVLTAANGAEALRQIEAHPRCRRMITDYVMPELGGERWIDVLERVAPGWTIVVMSSEDFDPGPFYYVPKPVDFDHIVRLFREPGR